MKNYTSEIFNEFGLTVPQAAAIVGVCFLIITVFAAYSVIKIIFNWKIFKKAQFPPLYSVPPVIHSLYYSELVFGRKIFAMIRLTFYIYAVFALSVTGAGVSPDSTLYFITGIFELVALCAVMYYRIVFSLGLSRCFGHGTAFAAGLFFFPTIFKGILALGKNSAYIDPVNFGLKVKNT